MIKILFISLFLLVSNFSFSQHITGNIQSISQEIVQDVSVRLVNLKEVVFIEDYTDEEGNYKLDCSNLFGEFTLQISYFDMELYSEKIRLDGADLKKNIILDVSQRLSINPVVISKKIENLEIIDFLNPIIDSNSFALAATFDDPSRAFQKFPGFMPANDQTNGISYRGMPAEMVRWSINGAEVLNPNHLSNAAMKNDYPNESSGGVLAIANDAIKSARFYSSGSNPDRTAGLGGVVDINLASDRDPSYFKVGLLGLELGVHSDDILNVDIIARYSTTGLITDLGADFNGEKIKYQDIYVNFEISPHVAFTNIIGSSSNYKSALPQGEANFYNDYIDNDFKSSVIINGITYKKKKLKTSLFLSQTRNIKESVRNYGLDTLQLGFNARPFLSYRDSKIKLAHHISTVFGEKVNNHWFNVGANSSLDSPQRRSDGRSRTRSFSIKPFINYNLIKTSINNINWFLKPGLAFYYDTANSECTIEPSLLIQASKKNSIIDFNIGANSQKISPVYLRSIDFDENIARMKGYHASLSYRLEDFANNQGLMIKGFAHVFTDVFNYSNDEYWNTSFYGAGFNDFRFWRYGSNSEFRIFGVEGALNKTIAKDWHFNVSSTYTIHENEQLIFKANISKSFALKDGKKLGFNLSGIHANHINFSNPFPYFRADLRLSYVFKDKNNLLLDIQNLSNTVNTAYQYIDPLLETYQNQEQLGIIPVLSYKRIF